MKKLEEIIEIVANMDEELFEKINDAESDYWNLDKRVSRNGYKRFVYNLKKAGLTKEEFWTWCAW